MTKFVYKAKDETGKIVTGTVQASSDFDAKTILQKNKLTPLEIVPENQMTTPTIFQPKITVKDRAVFARQLATTVGAGVTLIKSMSILAKQARNDRLKTIFFAVYKDLQEGYSFSNALAKHPEAFDKVFISVVKSGESSGNLDIVLGQLAENLEASQSFNLKLKGALYYPVFIIIALIGVGTYMLITVIPRLEELFLQAGTELPFATRVLIALSNFLTNQWWAVIIILLVIIFGGRYWLLSDSGSRTIDIWKLKIPVVKELSTGLYMSSFTRIMEMLIRSGVPILDSLRISSNTINNIIYEDSINRVAIEVERGVPLSIPLEKDPIFPKLISQMVAVGEQTGKLDVILDKVAIYYEQETSEKIKSISTLLEPIILLIVGIGVAFLIFAVLMPIYNIAQFQ